MTPLKLTLQNFLSYRDAVLDFTGFHTACICGPNGAGKSSLLEAVTWVIWGKSRTSNADDVIHSGETDVRVDFELMSHQQVYRIIRMRTKGRSASLQFQVKDAMGSFNAITGKGIRETQMLIDQELKLDYDTFINSAYLRQGHADEFMVAKPADRKRILGDLLKLEQYETLSQLAKEKAKTFKLKADILEESLAPQAEKLQAQSALEESLAETTAQIRDQRQQQQAVQSQRDILQAIAQQRQLIQGQLDSLKNQQTRQQQTLKRLAIESSERQQAIANNQAVLAEGETIETEFKRWQTLQVQETKLNHISQQYQDLLQTRQQLEQQRQQEEAALKQEMQQWEIRLNNLTEREQSYASIIAEAPHIAAALQTLGAARAELEQLQAYRLQAEPLWQAQQSLENQIEQVAARLTLKLESAHKEQSTLAHQVAQIPQQRIQLQQLNDKLVRLHHKKNNLEQLKQQKIEFSSQKLRLQDARESAQAQLTELQQKLALLAKPGAACPLCGQSLDPELHQTVLGKTHQQITATEAQIQQFQQELAHCTKELSNFAAAIAAMDKVQEAYKNYDRQLVHIEQALEINQGLQQQLKQVAQTVEQLEQSLRLEAYAKDLRLELAQVDQQLSELRYDEQQWAIAQAKEKEYRWAEIKQGELQQAEEQLADIQQERPKYQAQLERAQLALQSLPETSPIHQSLAAIATELSALNYDRNAHRAVRDDRQKAQGAQRRKLELDQAQQQQTVLKKRLDESQQRLSLEEKQHLQLQQDIKKLQANLAETGDRSAEIDSLDQQFQDCRQALESAIAHRGQLEQSIAQLQAIATEQKQQKKDLKELRHQYQVHYELAQAFGKNGIQALMIENALPQLEAETNQILGRLSDYQFHVQFRTQRSKKGSKKQAAQMIDTLDILIADTRGTRAYETYSGGEAFRINFSIRLALAKLLAYNSGTTLQMLVIDEGFGTQDAEGCGRLIGAINAIADDFTTILAVTHIPQFKEAFQSRIEVYKDQQGSQLRVNN